MSVMNRRIHVMALSLAGGLSWGIFMVILAAWVMITGHGALMLSFFSDVYPYYNATVPACFWGLLWGFSDVFTVLFIFGFLYNLFAFERKTT